MGIGRDFDVEAHNRRVQAWRDKEAAESAKKNDLAGGSSNPGATKDCPVGARQFSIKGPDAATSVRAIADAGPIYPLVNLCRSAGLPLPIPEYQWHPSRKFRADYAFVIQRVLIEYDGGLFINGGHSRGKARLYDMAKDRAATLLGWRTLRYGVSEMGTTIADLRILFAGPEAA